MPPGSDQRRTSQARIGRGAGHNPANRFESVRHELDLEALAAVELNEDFVGDEDGDHGTLRKTKTEFFPDATKSIIATNDSPDISFSFSINPYRGCEHGCAYCYARPGHEYLGLSGGLDFETKIFVKHDAATLLRDELNKPSWKGTESIAISGVTDCYQPAERQFKITRGILEVCLEAGQACGIVTKNALVLRDIDLLSELARRSLVRVYISITTLDAELARSMEPRTSPPVRRLAAIRALSAAGVPTGVMTAPIIPGLNDVEIPALLQAAAEAGAQTASYVLLRLPHSVRPVFEEWLTRCYPQHADRVLGHIQATRGGKMNGTQFGTRMSGEGNYAEGIRTTFALFRKKYKLDGAMPPYDFTQFRPPSTSEGQQRLF
ncbi:MAG: PA0069 family radical SAM protein [Planctomycetota bacterium]|nr:PA0069 family radical SAM protein [Planctomycetota bacterium]